MKSYIWMGEFPDKLPWYAVPNCTVCSSILSINPYFIDVQYILKGVKFVDSLVE